MKSVFFDVMLRGMFVATLRFRYPSYKPLSLDDLREYTLAKLPTLKGEDFKIMFNQNN